MLQNVFLRESVDFTCNITETVLNDGDLQLKAFSALRSKDVFAIHVRFGAWWLYFLWFQAIMYPSSIRAKLANFLINGYRSNNILMYQIAVL